MFTHCKMAKKKSSINFLKLIPSKLKTNKESVGKYILLLLLLAFLAWGAYSTYQNSKINKEVSKIYTYPEAVHQYKLLRYKYGKPSEVYIDTNDRYVAWNNNKLYVKLIVKDQPNKMVLGSVPVALTADQHINIINTLSKVCQYNDVDKLLHIKGNGIAEIHSAIFVISKIIAQQYTIQPESKLLKDQVENDFHKVYSEIKKGKNIVWNKYNFYCKESINNLGDSYLSKERLVKRYTPRVYTLPIVPP